MQHTPSQLKEKLLEGIDNEYNVVNLPKVLEVICLLEKCTITREALEETRIGRLVNDVRRKTRDKQLAKRAKDLVRSWQKVVNGSESNTTVNGDGLNSSAKPQGNGKHIKSPVSSVVRPASVTPVNKHGTQKSVKSSLSQGKLSSKPNTPTLQQQRVNNETTVQKPIKRSNSSSQFHPSSAKRLCRSPVPGSQPGTPDSICSQGSRASFTTLPQTPSSHSLPDIQASSERKTLERAWSSDNLSKKDKSSDIQSVHSHSDAASVTEDRLKTGQNGIIKSKSDINFGEPSTHSIEPKGLKTTIRLKNPALLNGETPKKRGRGRPPKNKPQIIASSTFEPPPYNGSASDSKTFTERKNVHLGLKTDPETPTPRGEKFKSMTPKVKSTAELMQSLLEKNNLSVGKDTVRQISSNLIQKECDDDHYAVPDGVKPRQHRKKGSKNDVVPPSTPVSLNKTKSEMVQKFLESSVTESNPDDLSPLKYELPRTESPGNASTSFEDSVSVDGNPDSSKNTFMDRIRQDQTESSSVISGGKPPSHHQTSGSDRYPQPTSSNPLRTNQEDPSSAERPLTLEEIYSKYPPLDLDNFVLDDDTYEVSEPVEITDSDIHRVHNEHWSGVNGCQDMFDEWTDWSQTLSLPSVNGDPLHILPYVCID